MKDYVRGFFIVLSAIQFGYGLQIASTKPMEVQANPICTNSKDVVYHISKGVVCVPQDVLFAGGFE